MFNTQHLTEGVIREGATYPYPLCGQAGYEPSLLIDPDSTAWDLYDENQDACWECRSIVA